MAKYFSKYDLLKAADEEINDFFKENTFTGMYSTLMSEDLQGTFCGQITNILLNGEENGLCPKTIYVPIKYAQYVKEGLCEFHCFPNFKLLRDEKHIYRLNIVNIKNVEIKKGKSAAFQDEKLFRRNLKLRNNLFIGQFIQNIDGSFKICDIRRSDFSKLILQNGKEQPPIVFHPKIMRPTNGRYYEFSWILVNADKERYSYAFKVDESQPYKEILASDVINRLHTSIMDYSADAGQKIVKMLDTLKNQLTASGKEIFIYELLQNANDYPFIVNNEKQKVDVEFHITRDSLLFMHSGAEFNEKNIAALCSINDKEKTDNKEAIGYKGIGFKTVFLDNNYVYLQTRDFSFRFDKKYSEDIVDTPWQILPVWTKFNELTPAEKYVFTNADKKFRVKFALRPINQRTLRDAPQNYVKMFMDVFQNERVILFIPYLSSVKVFYNSNPTPDIVCNCDNDSWRVDTFEYPVDEALTESINDSIDEQEDTGSLKIPTKYYDFTRTKVSFACEVEGVELKEVKDTQIYCYLPTKATWGFKFLMNTDMIPTGPRDDIEVDFSDSININAEIAQIAGSQFFDWIVKLCASKQYKLNSIFNLIPVFETNIKEHGKYNNLIERFKIGFDEKVKTLPLIPVGKDNYELLSNVILDETGLLASGIMTDEDFYTITGMAGKLPMPVLRNDRYFNAFLKRYLKDFGKECNIWQIEDLIEICSDTDFIKWISVQENNNKFIDFLLKKDYLSSFFGESIFIDESGGKLCTASELYYDIEEALSDLRCFEDKLPRLSTATRTFFKSDKKWEDAIKGQFKDFDANSFVTETLLSDVNKNKSCEILKGKDASVRFFSFITKNKISFQPLFMTLPFISDDEKAVDSFENHILFFHSEDGHKVAEMDWMSKVDIKFISTDYEEATLSFFKEKFGVKEFSDETIVKDVISSQDYQNAINDSIADDIVRSISFVNYCYAHKEYLSASDLSPFSLRVHDGNGDEQWYLAEGDVFIPSSKFDDYSAKEWISYDWMTSVDEEYFKNIISREDFISFLCTYFNVEILTETSFYNSVVKPHTPDIIKDIKKTEENDCEKNIDFVKYLDDNYSLIFETSKDKDLFKDISLISNSLTDLPISDNVYLYDDDLLEVIAFDWFPKDMISICDKRYGKSKSLLLLGCKQYSFGTFYDEVISNGISDINKCVTSKASSISFHGFITDHLSSLTPDQQKKMSNAKVYLYGRLEPSTSSSGHKTLSSNAKEIFEKGFVQFSDLDIIDPEYNTDEHVDYWEAQLGNSKYKVSHFISWIQANTTVFATTLSDDELNKFFWRWALNNVPEKQIELLPSLPVILKDNSRACSKDAIYFSDEYLSGAGIEQTVLLFDSNARFVSPSYFNENDDISAWKSFWEKIGIKHEIIDILYGTVIPRLSDIDNPGLPRLLSENRESLEKRYEDGLIPHIKDLRVQSSDGTYRKISECIYVDCEKEEPFKYIILPNQISFSSADERRLVKDIIALLKSDIVSTLSEWQQRKVERYLLMQNSDISQIETVHFSFIDDLAAIRNDDREVLKEIEGIEQIKLLNKDGQYVDAKSLTMGSAYNPFFDFEVCGVTSLTYVSDFYSQKCTEYVGRLFRAMHVHCDFFKDDVSLLSSRSVSEYFWGQYLIKKDAPLGRIKDIINDKLLDDLACIPTKDFMKSPKDLYHGETVQKYFKAIEDWENKVPLTTIPEIKIEETPLFNLLPFKQSLDFLDALYALLFVTGQDKRTQLLNWMISADDGSYENKINEYRDEQGAVWNNNRNESVQIKNLYALEYGNKVLGQYFGTNPRIINNQYLPSGESFKTACDLLKIDTITEGKLKMEPIGDSIDSSRQNDLLLYALVFAGIGYSDKWAERYQEYAEKVKSLTLHRCDSITIMYEADSEICQSFRRFYHKNGTDDFYFVDSIDGKQVFLLFVSEFVSYIGVEGVTEEIINEIMDSPRSAIDYVSGYNELMLDDAFTSEMDRLNPGIKSSLKGTAASNSDEEYVYRPSFTTVSDVPQTQDNIDEDNDESEIEASTSYDEKKNNSVMETRPDRPSTPDNKSSVNSDPQVERVVSQSISPDNDTKQLSKESTSTERFSATQEDIDYTASETIDLPDSFIDNEDDEEDDEPKVQASRVEAMARQKEEQRPTDYEKSKLKSRSAYKGQWQPAQEDSPTVRQRRNYSGYSPDKFKARQFNAGTQEPLTLSRRDIDKDEVQYLSNLFGRALNIDTIKDENYIVRMRFFNSLKENGLEMDMSERDFIEHGSSQITTKSGKYVHRCSARSGILYISPTVWNRLREGRWVICFYSGKMADQFVYVRTQDELMEIINQDALVIQVTGNNKQEMVDKIYEDGFSEMEGNIYTLIRTIKVEGEVTPFDENVTDYFNDDDDQETDEL